MKILTYVQFLLEFQEHDPRHKKYGVYNSYISPSPDGSADHGTGGDRCSSNATPGSTSGGAGASSAGGTGASGGSDS